jgi:hypothetical protein
MLQAPWSSHQDSRCTRHHPPQAVFPEIQYAACLPPPFSEMIFSQNYTTLTLLISKTRRKKKGEIR